MPTNLQQIHILVSGLVQGVGFRYATQREASRLGLRGWVKNTPDGKVEIMAEGPEVQVTRLTEWCRSGPPGARVNEVQVLALDFVSAPSLAAFSIAR